MLLPPVNPDFQLLVDRHYSALYRFALSLSGSGDAAADLVQQTVYLWAEKGRGGAESALVQETFYLWAEKGHQLRDSSKAKSWLFTSLYREYLGTYRRN